jgi:uncharacterized protein (TIGR02145 family)
MGIITISLKPKITMKSYFFLFFYSTFLYITLNGQVINSNEIDNGKSMQRKTSFNMEEIKVRWKKAALENCTGVPCVVTPPAPSFTCGTSTITDIDGNVYNTILIGTQCWTKENLKVTMYSDGTLIQFNNMNTNAWSALRRGAYAIYNNEPNGGTNATNYGYLYNWYAVKGIDMTGSTTYKNLCPTGYHVPSDPEWTIMIKSLDPGQLINSTNVSTFNAAQSNTAGTLMKEFSGLWINNNGTNTSFFSARPGGFRDNDTNGTYSQMGTHAWFWSNTEVPGAPTDAWIRSLNENPSTSGTVNRRDWNKPIGGSVRCLKD